MARAWDVTLTGIATVPCLACELDGRPNVEEQQSHLAETALQLFEPDRLHGHRAYDATTASSASIDGRCESRSSQSPSAGNRSSETPITSRARITQGT